jgi:C4-type Zn-finger protein
MKPENIAELLNACVAISALNFARLSFSMRPCPTCGGEVSVYPERIFNPDFTDSRLEARAKCMRCFKKSDVYPLDKIVEFHNTKNILTIYPAPGD